MSKLVSDRRLWTTAEGDQVVEDGDPRARFLLVGCAGRMIPAAVAARLELEVEDGRLTYPGCPEIDGAGGAAETEDGDDPVVHKFGGDKTGGRDKIDPQGGDGADTGERAPPKGGAESAVAVDDLATRRAAAEALQEEKAKAREEAADDSDRNEDGAPEEWTGRTSPEAYIKNYPTGPQAEHARAVIAAQDDGADGGS